MPSTEKNVSSNNVFTNVIKYVLFLINYLYAKFVLLVDPLVKMINPEPEVDYTQFDTFDKDELVRYVNKMKPASFDYTKDMFDDVEVTSSKLHTNLIELVEKLTKKFKNTGKTKKSGKRSRPKLLFAKWDLIKDYEETEKVNDNEFISNYIENPKHKFNTGVIDKTEYMNSFAPDKYSKDMMQVSKKLLESLPPYYLNKVLSFYNSSLLKGAEPMYCFGRMAFAHKKGDKNDLGNYRKITTVPNLVNHFHRIIGFRIKEYMEKNNYFDTTIQKAGIAGCSYGLFEQVFKVRSVIKDAHKYKKSACVLFVDLKSAFDSIDRDRIYEVLAEYNVDKNVINYLRGFYDNLQYCLIAGRKTSELKKWKSGLIQGCSLSPTLFTICMNYVLSYINKTSLEEDGYKLSNSTVQLLFLAFMDDICITTKDVESMGDVYEEFIQQCNMLGLDVNMKKCVMMMINDDKEVPEILKSMPQKDEVTYLGNIITKDGSAQTNYDNVKGDIYGKLGKVKFSKRVDKANMFSELFPSIKKSLLKLYDVDEEDVLKVQYMIQKSLEEMDIDYKKYNLDISAARSHILKTTEDGVIKDIPEKLNNVKKCDKKPTDLDLHDLKDFYKSMIENPENDDKKD